jgi:hypothetical protein
VLTLSFPWRCGREHARCLVLRFPRRGSTCSTLSTNPNAGSVHEHQEYTRRLQQRIDHLDAAIEDAQASLVQLGKGMLTPAVGVAACTAAAPQSPPSTTVASVPYADILSLDALHKRLVIAVRAPAGSTLAVPGSPGDLFVLPLHRCRGVWLCYRTVPPCLCWGQLLGRSHQRSKTEATI